MINENFKYIDEAQQCADYMIEHLYDQAMWWLDEQCDVLNEDEFNEVHAEFMRTVLLMMLQD